MRTIVGAAIAAACMLPAPVLAQAGLSAGPRVEATVGWDRVNIGSDGEDVGKSGVEYGGEAGYDLAVGSSAILGAYAGIDGASTKECLSGGTERLCISAGRNIQLGARAGTRVGSNLLAYIKGGYSNGRLRATYTDSAVPSDNFRESANADGFHVGAGAEVGFRGGFYGKAEYVYTRYSTDEDVDARLDRHRVLAGVGYRF